MPEYKKLQLNLSGSSNDSDSIFDFNESHFNVNDTTDSSNNTKYLNKTTTKKDLSNLNDSSN